MSVSLIQFILGAGVVDWPKVDTLYKIVSDKFLPVASTFTTACLSIVLAGAIVKAFVLK